jgi:hypothetical protein
VKRALGAAVLLAATAPAAGAFDLSGSLGGLDLSLESSDDLFANTSVMTRAAVAAGVAFELFLDDSFERHHAGEENFSVFSFSATLAREF